MKIFVFVYFFYYNDMAVGWSYDNTLRILTTKIADRTLIEIKYYTIDSTEHDCKNPKWYLRWNCKPENQSYKDKTYTSVEQCICPFVMDSNLFEFLFYFSHGR